MLCSKHARVFFCYHVWVGLYIYIKGYILAKSVRLFFTFYLFFSNSRLLVFPTLTPILLTVQFPWHINNKYTFTIRFRIETLAFMCMWGWLGGDRGCYLYSNSCSLTLAPNLRPGDSLLSSKETLPLSIIPYCAE